jgi:two-component system phosphate regulon sensor histidine kinase PhoR
MNKRRLHTPVILMLLAIMAVLGFQIYWLNKNYREEKHLLQIRTNVLFRDVVNQCQVEKLKLDSNIKIRVSAGRNAVGMMNAIRQKVDIDTGRMGPKTNATVVIAMNKDELTTSQLAEPLPAPPDSLRQSVHFYSRPGQAEWIQLLQGVDSLQDSVTVKEITDRYASMLRYEKIDLPFSVTRKEVRHPEQLRTLDSTIRKDVRFRDELVRFDMEEANEVTVGFFRPLTFTLNLENRGTYLLKKLMLPILVSIFLVGITVFSFVLLLRNLMQQRRLAQLKNEFVSNITHELKTPIATVGVAIEALRNFNAINDPERTREYLDISSAEIHRLGLLVDKVLKLSMFENREIALQKESFDLLQLTQEVMASMKLQFEKQNAIVTLETSGNNFVIEADKLHISSVVYNLLDNALKYSKEKPEIDIYLSAHSQHVSLQVSDKGIGIPKEYKGKIFEKFFRIPGGDRHNIKGYGLGLSYVNHILHRHMGFIEVKSELGKGSTFIVNIPYKEADTIRFDEHRTIRKVKLRIG